MVHALRRGQNATLSELAPSGTDLARVAVGVGWELDVTAPALDADVLAVLVGADGQVVSDAHLVFYNNDASPEGAARLSGVLEGGSPGDDRQRLTLDLAGTPPEVERVVVALAVSHRDETTVEDPPTLTDVRDVYLRVAVAPADDDEVGPELVRYAVDHEPTIENALVLGEVYRFGEEWKVMAVGQGFASGLRGVATEYGVHV